MSTERPVSSKPSRRDVILDAAEQLFAMSGVDAVSVRNIADAAGVKLSLVTYHFPSKDQLFVEVLARRSKALSNARRTLLDVHCGADGFDLRFLVVCYTRPLLDMASRDDVGWRSYAHLTAQVAQSHRHSAIIAELYDDTAVIFLGALKELYPHTEEDRCIRALVYLVTVMLGVFSSNGRVETLSNGRLSSDPEKAYDSMCDFIVGGVHNMLAN